MYYTFTIDRFPSIIDFYTINLSLNDPVVNLVDSYHKLCIVLSGSLKLGIDGEAYDLKEGDVFFIPANHQYSKTVTSENTVLCNTVFSIQDDLQQLDQDSLIYLILQNQDKSRISSNNPNSETGTIYLQKKTTVEKESQLANLLSDLSKYENTDSMLYNLQISVLLCNIFIALSEITLGNLSHQIQREPKTQFREIINKPLEYIHTHYTEKILLDDICTHCNISKSQLTRIFKAVMGTTPSKYISDYKLSRAKELLFYYPNKTINEISMQLGFDTQHYFSKQFSKTYGISPTYYRKKKLESSHEFVKSKN